MLTPPAGVPLRPPVAPSRSALAERDDAVQRVLVDPAWRSQLLISLTVLNWLHQDEPDREDLVGLAHQLATPGQRRLRLHQRWAERDRAAFENPYVPAVDAWNPVCSRVAHAGFHRSRRGPTRRETWKLDSPTDAIRDMPSV